MIYILMFVLILTIFISQTYILSQGDKTSVDTVMFSTRQSLHFVGVIVRDETLVYSEMAGSGVLNYEVPDGSRLSKHSQIARVYRSDDQIYYRYIIDKLSLEIDALQKAQNKGTTEYAQPEFISSGINERYKSILSGVVKNDLSSLEENKLEMLKLMCINNIASNAESSYDERLSYLTGQRSSYESMLVSPLHVVNSVDSGYFTSVTDGYESLLSIEDIPNMTVESINEVISNPQPGGNTDSNVIGKVFKDYNWKLVGVIDTPDRYFVNDTYNVEFTNIGKTYKGFVESITLTGNGNEAIMVIDFNQIDAEIAAARVVDAEILFGEYSGIKVPRTAIRFVDGEKGAYVLEGERMSFKKLDVIFEGDIYVLSRYIPADKSYLGLYSRVLLDPVPTADNTVKPNDSGEKVPPDSDAPDGDADNNSDNSTGNNRPDDGGGQADNSSR